MKTTTLIAGALALTMGMTALAADAEGRQRGGERASFSELDADGNGEVTLAEMQAFAEARFAANDIDGDGFLSAEEIVAARSAENAERMEQRIARFIERADDNGDGLLEFSEMGPGEERAANRFERIDTDGSGGISQEEMETAREARQERGWRPFGGDRG